MNYIDQQNVNYLKAALNNTNYKPRQYNDWYQVANQQIASPDYSSLFRQAYQGRDTGINRLKSAFSNAMTGIKNSYNDSKQNLTTQQTNNVNSALTNAAAGGLGGSDLANYRRDKIKDTYQPSFDRLDREKTISINAAKNNYGNNLEDLYQKYRESVAGINAQKEDRGLKVASEATRLLQQDQKGYRDWSRDVAKMLQDYSQNQQKMEYQQQQDAFQNSLAQARFDWDQKQTLLPYTMGPTPAQMLPYKYPSANSLLPYNMGPTPLQQASLLNNGSGNNKSAAISAAYQALLNNPQAYMDPSFMSDFFASGLTPSDFNTIYNIMYGGSSGNGGISNEAQNEINKKLQLNNG
ncbi:hypothetical protein Dtox_3708 [Desulfofarcimen acetoxidans DSM 771]|uniref:Uncharacterized protein n=1 Tax=Desulfofarcimen acetoxidans (strain ATCC 49208 / DSM 771 / KCTC 5769 / VKM B-1644 / 5575) TaxID=485916 RepID=C8VWQ2_DESAS|nr:hypothetical protein [Desulfofarcimen acetoxidans]ACV64416.1 hypothetical protein Dtox_3708 [Desulfofarcimen acetoxidans DSM 771]